MKNEEQDRKAVAVTCGNVTVLLPIREVKQIYAREQVIEKNKNQYLLEGLAYSGYFLYDLLNLEKEMVNYAILLQSDKQEYILFVEKVLNVITLDKPCVLPFYMLCPPFSYIEDCYHLNPKQIGFQLDVFKLINNYQTLHMEADYGK